MGTERKNTWGRKLKHPRRSLKKIEQGEMSKLFATLHRYYRAREGMTQSQLCNELYKLGHPCVEGTISMWENGYRLPEDASTIYWLGQALQLDDEEELALLHAFLVDRAMHLIERYLKLKGDDAASLSRSLLADLTERFRGPSRLSDALKLTGN